MGGPFFAALFLFSLLFSVFFCTTWYYRPVLQKSIPFSIELNFAVPFRAINRIGPCQKGSGIPA